MTSPTQLPPVKRAKKMPSARQEPGANGDDKFVDVFRNSLSTTRKRSAVSSGMEVDLKNEARNKRAVASSSISTKTLRGYDYMYGTVYASLGLKILR